MARFKALPGHDDRNLLQTPFSPIQPRLCLRVFLAAPLVLMATVASAHHPDRKSAPVRPRIDLIGPIGNHLPPEYRRQYNRPTNIGGKIAYCIAPSSQEAMAWHRAQHSRAYECDRPRLVRHYFYPKPWEALKIGAPDAQDPAESEPLDELGVENVISEAEAGIAPQPIVVTSLDASLEETLRNVGVEIEPATPLANTTIGRPASSKNTARSQVSPAQFAEAVQSSVETSTADDELRKLRAENRRLKMERDLLKRATGLFGKTE